MSVSRKGPLAWFAANHVASNILMIFILASGALSLLGVVIEVFPEIVADTVTVQVPYRGASPAEAEEGVCVRVEEAIASIEGIKRISVPSRRVYVTRDKLPRVMGGFGTAIISTSRGVMTDKEARQAGVGGEVLCHIW